MTRAGSVTPTRLNRRMCLSCGFAGRALQGDGRESDWVCPRCGEDLYARPPKSYAELEALSDSNPGAVDDSWRRPGIQRVASVERERMALTRVSAFSIAAAALVVLILSLGVMLGAAL